MFCTENKQTRGGSRTPRSSMMELFVTMEVISYWQSSSNLDDGGIVELPQYASSVSMIKLESWRRTKTKRTQAFYKLVPSSFSRCEEYNFLLPLLRNSCSLIHLYSGVSRKCYFNQYPYFGNIQIIFISKHEIFSAINFD